MKELLTALVHDVDYQYRLRADFRRRRVHPSIEALAWAHVIGKPAERVQVSADMSLNQKLEGERELFGTLSVQQLEVLAAESQSLVDRATAMARANALPPHDTVPAGRQSQDARARSGSAGFESALVTDDAGTDQHDHAVSADSPPSRSVKLPVVLPSRDVRHEAVATGGSEEEPVVIGVNDA